MANKIKIVTERERFYSVKDEALEVFANFEILEMDKIKKTVLLRLETKRECTNDELTDLITKIFKTFVKTGDFYKVNILSKETSSISPFLRLGFNLEGILYDNIYEGQKSFDEYIFGADSTNFKSLDKVYKPIEIKGDRITLKLALASDAKEFLNYYITNREMLDKVEPSKDKQFYTEIYQEEDLKYRYSQYLKGNAIFFGIYLEDRLIGKMRLSNIVYGSLKSCSIGYALHKDYLNKSLMTEAVKVAVNYCFKDLGLHRVEATTLKENVASQKVLDKAGFKYAGCIKQYQYINGKWEDSYLFSISKNQK